MDLALAVSNSNRSSHRESKNLRASGVAREVWRLIHERRGRLALGVGLIAIGRVAGLVLPASPKVLIDWVIGRDRWDLLLPLVLVATAAAVVQSLTSLALAVVVGVAAQRSITEARMRLQRHLIRLPVPYFDSHRTGVMISRIMTDPNGIRNLVGTGFVQLVGGLFTASLSYCVLLYLSWRMTVTVSVLLLLFGGGLAAVLKRLRPIYREQGRLNAELTGRLNEMLGGIRIVKAYSAAKREDLVFARGAHRLFRKVVDSMLGIAGLTAYSTFLVGMIGVVILWMGGSAVRSGSMSLGDVVTYVVFAGMVVGPLVQISSVGTQLSEALAGLDRMRDIERLATEDVGEDSRQPLGEVRGDLAFEDVTFEYEPDVPVLESLNFRAPAGSTTALVGPSGAGKSTLTSLVMAFNRPTRGRVTVDGRDLARIRLRDYRRILGVVLQEDFLFASTVAANIAYGRPGASRDDLERAAELAHCTEFIDRLPQGYETKIGERGVKLSAGQRQRIAIARAIVADPKLLILDEATSNLDSRSEVEIQDGLRTLRRGRTSFVIAHRLSTIMSADQILVLDQGRIVERGTHTELLAEGGLYRQLFNEQRRLVANRFVNPGEDPVPEPRAEAETRSDDEHGSELPFLPKRSESL